MGAPRYRGLVFDSARWDGFRMRPGDIVVSTPPKCGTTWTQMICALLIFQEPDLPAPLPVISPWIDQVSRSRKVVYETLEAQTHRRFVKTHTPLDGLPHDPGVTYLCVGRDPRDAAVSMDNHMANLDIAVFAKARAEAAAIDGIELDPLPKPPAPSPDPAARFWRWVDDDTDPTESGSTLRFTLTHLQGCADPPAEIDVALLHYDDLQADLEGQMRGLAARLEIDVAEERWPVLVEAASFDAMRSRATTTAPGASPEQWRDPSRFFNKGTSGQWRDLIDDAGVERYAARVQELASDELSDWVHRGPLLP
jgi:aryl sulfotransferase